MADLWAVAIGEREQFKEAGAGLERLHAVPLLLLHRRRAVALAGKGLAQQALSRLRRRFPDARLVAYPGGPEDALVVDAALLPELLSAYGLGAPPGPPRDPAAAALLTWAREPGPVDPLPPEQGAAGDPALLAALLDGLARGQVQGARALALIAAAGTREAHGFLTWALAADDAEFQAKYGRRGEQALAAVQHVPDAAAPEFSRRLLWDQEHTYGWRASRACVQRLVGLGEPGLAALADLCRGHRLEPYLRRWTTMCQRGHGQAEAAGPE